MGQSEQESTEITEDRSLRCLCILLFKMTAGAIIPKNVRRFMVLQLILDFKTHVYSRTSPVRQSVA